MEILITKEYQLYGNMFRSSVHIFWRCYQQWYYREKSHKGLQFCTSALFAYLKRLPKLRKYAQVPIPLILASLPIKILTWENITIFHAFEPVSHTYLPVAVFKTNITTYSSYMYISVPAWKSHFSWQMHVYGTTPASFSIMVKDKH